MSFFEAPGAGGFGPGGAAPPPGGGGGAPAGGGGGAGAAAGGGMFSGAQGFGNIVAMFGAATAAIGAFYGVQANRYALRSRALDLHYAGTQAGLNARLAEREADILLTAGREAGAASALRFAQVRAESDVRTAGAGLQAGVGSAGEVAASIELAKDIDAMVIERNTVQAVGAARLRAADLRSQAAFARARAASAREFSGTLSPGLAALTSLIGGASQVASGFINQQSGL